MLRLIFVLSAAFYLVLGGALYFLPAAGVGSLTVSPLWVARVAGAVVLAWGLLLALSAVRPSGASVGALVAANLLAAATLAPAALRGPAFLGLAAAPVLVLAGLLTLLAVLALVLPRARPRL